MVVKSSFSISATRGDTFPSTFSRHVRARRREREDEVAARDLLEDDPHAAIVHSDEVLEAEHQVADRLAELRRELGECGEHPLADRHRRRVQYPRRDARTRLHRLPRAKRLDLVVEDLGQSPRARRPERRCRSAMRWTTSA
jgi:hypothetical protein